MIIESRLDKRSMGFGAEVQSKKERDVGQLLKEIQPQDLLKFGIIPELVGRLPVLTTLQSLSLIHIWLWKRLLVGLWSVVLVPVACVPSWRRS